MKSHQKVTKFHHLPRAAARERLVAQRCDGNVAAAGLAESLLGLAGRCLDTGHLAGELGGLTGMPSGMLWS